ncbi:hypothetical protein ACFQY4_43885 [Catellatospora bangladeshensis]|uniref:hypothetical protein n=1 Tax=Catellatospora bangladeshensis TaxID=310355 RepID=UPI0036116009
MRDPVEHVREAGKCARVVCPNSAPRAATAARSSPAATAKRSRYADTFASIRSAAAAP